MSSTTTSPGVGEMASAGVRPAEGAPGAIRQTVLPEADAKAVLRRAGIAVPPGVTATRVDGVARHLREPLVLKAISPTLVHKSDAGGVRVGLTHGDLPAAVASMGASVTAAGHQVSGYLVEEMAPAGVEVVVGAIRTPGVGWAVMVGLGGVFVEVLADVAFGVAPLGRRDIADMLDELRGVALLRGARGGRPLAEEDLVDLIARVAGPGGLLESVDDTVVEVDLNPVIVSETGAVAVDARFVLRDPESDAPAPAPLPPAAPTDLGHLYAPEVVAVLGAKAAGTNGANLFIRNLCAAGYAGRVVPVHPTAEVIEGIPAVPSLAAVGEPVDYAYVALPAARVADALSAGAGLVRFAQVVSSGFGETGDGVELERQLVARTRELGIRVIGPNCLGTHSSQARLSFVPDAPLTPGGIAVISQSGGLSVDILRAGAARGLDFHSVTSIGNACDVTAAELLAHLLDAREVSVVGLYLESLSAARSVMDVLVQRAGRPKPVVLLAGGRTADGSRAAASHTGALAGNHRLWPAIARQAGATLADSLEAFVNVLLAFDTAQLSIGTTRRDVVVFGNGGGASVLAADALDRQGLRTSRLPDTTIDRLGALGLPPGNGLHNPIDVPAGSLAVGGGTIAGDILDIVLETSEPAAVISHLNVGIIQANLAETHGDVTGRIIESIATSAAGRPSHQLLVLRGDGTAGTDEQIRGYTRRARSVGLPVYPSIEEAAVAAAALLAYEGGRR